MGRTRACDGPFCGFGITTGSKVLKGIQNWRVMCYGTRMSLENAYKTFERGKSESIAWLHNETSSLRTGRVKPDLVDSITIEHYGVQTPLKGLASVSNSDARTLVISPWDPSAIAAIKKALTEAQLGVQPVEDGRMVRLSFSSMTDDVREQTVKMLHKKAEEARVRLRRARDEALSMIRQEKQDGEVTEDDFYEGKKKLDEKIDEANEEISKLVSKKEDEIRVV